MNWLDIIIAVVIAIPAVFGFRKGFLRKILGILGIVIGFILAVKFYLPVSEFIGSIIKSNSGWIIVISFLIIIGVVYGLSVWLARFISGLNSGTAMIDKILGGILGFVEGAIIASILTVNLNYLNVPDAQTKQSSNLYPVVYNIAPSIFDRIIKFSPDLKNLYDNYKKVFKS